MSTIHPVRRRGFTLPELLIVIAIVAMLLGLLFPSVASVRRSALATRDLTQIRALQTAHWSYALEHRGRFIDVGLPHGGSPDEEVAWINTLRPYYDNKLVLRSPLDDSPHWPVEDGGAGVPLPGQATESYRRTSYGVNNYLTRFFPEDPGDPEDDDWATRMRMSLVPNPAATCHFLIMAFYCTDGEDCFAGADHIHVENWNHPLQQARPGIASGQVEINAVRGPEASWESVSNYGFLDGHVETAALRSMYLSFERNRFDPTRAPAFDRALNEDN